MRNFFYPETDSTNHSARQLLAVDRPKMPFWVSANFQTRGRGHGSNLWESDRGQNITASLIYSFRQLPAVKQFTVSQAISLGMIDFLDLFITGAQIKWPNDIYVDDMKIAGLLIENDIAGDQISLSVIGIGLNINQMSFSKDLPNPVSLRQLTGFQYDLTELIELLDDRLINRLNALEGGQLEDLTEEYQRNLYRFKQFFPYETKGEWFEARITGLGSFGELILETKEGAQRSFGFKEVEFIL